MSPPGSLPGAFGADRFVEIFRENGREISAEQKHLLERYVEYLRDWNLKINLVSRRDEENIWLRQILASSLFLANHDFAPNTRILDLGTGGGLPGIPIAILCPSVSVLLVDSIAKKIRAVEDITRQLKLPNVSAVCSRVEELRGYDGTFDYIIARAVAPMSEIIRWTKHLLKRGPAGPGLSPGSIVLLKGGDLEEELQEARKRYAPSVLTVESLPARGLDDEMLPDKKIVIIRL